MMLINKTRFAAFISGKGQALRNFKLVLFVVADLTYDKAPPPGSETYDDQAEL